MKKLLMVSALVLSIAALTGCEVESEDMEKNSSEKMD